MKETSVESNNKPGQASPPVGANKLTAPLLRHKRWIIGAAGALATYTVGGFWLLPQLVQSQLPKFAHSELERNASIGAVRFNPFTLRLEADNFHLDEANGAPLFAVGKLAVELNWSSIVRRAWSVAEVRIVAPSVRLAIAPDGSFNIAQFLDTLNRRPQEPSSGMPRLIIGHFALEQGRVEVSDRRAGYADTITPIDFALNNLSTLPDQNGDYTLSADATHGGKLHWRGTAALNPIGGSGELTLDQLALPGLASYLKAYTRVSVSSGKLSAKLPYRFAYANGKLDASLSGASLSLRELALVSNKAGAPFANVNAFDISEVGADLAAHTVTIGSVRLSGAKLEARRNAKGELDLAQLMIAAPASASAPTPALTKAPASATVPASASASATATATATATTVTAATVAAPTAVTAATAAPASAPSASTVATAAPAAKPTAGAASNWKVQLKQLTVEQLGMSLVDETVNPALRVAAENVQLKLALQAEQAADGLKMSVTDAAFSLAELSMVSGKRAPLKLAQLGFTGGTVDLAGRQLNVDRIYADGGQLDLTRDSKGQFMFMSLLPKAASSAAAPATSPTASKAPAKTLATAPKTANTASTASTASAANIGSAAGTAAVASTATVASPASKDSAAWSGKIGSVELSKFGALYDDQSSGIKVNLQDFNLKLDGVSNDLKQALPFKLAVGLREGGQLTGQGRIVPATGALESTLLLKGLALAPVQPLLAKHVKLKIAGGVINGQGQLNSGGAGTAKNPTLRYAGMFEVAGLRLNEQDNDLFAAWKSVRADKLTLNIGPDSLDIPELRVVEPNAKLIIENDRSFNAQRLLVRPPEQAGAAPAAGASAAASAKAVAPAQAAASAPATSSAKASAVKAPAAKAQNGGAQAANGPDADAGFPVRVRRLRLQNAKLDFADLSLRPQFGAKIYELNGIVNGLSTRRDARSQIELDGRVDEFGLARVRGQLNPFVPADNTDLSVVFKNVDMVSASPYSMKFAGYKIAEGKISLDLQYKVRDGALEGDNHIVLDNMTLGEHIDSPDALKLPLELALAILKDSDGRIDLGLPVSGNLNDPQFSYGALVWKAVGNVLSKVVTAPFRALGALLGINGDKLEAVDFDAGSARLLPPEREKLKQVAQILAKRAQLSVTVPGQYSEAVDGAALREQALRRKVTARAGIKLEVGEAAGPLNLGERAVRSALRELYAERFGEAELDKQKKAAEAAGAAAPAGGQAAGAAPAKLPVWQRMGKLIQGEPQVADASAFYGKLRERLEASEALPADALAKLGAQRAAAIVAALAEAGVNAASARVGAPEPVGAEAGKQVALKLGLSAK